MKLLHHARSRAAKNNCRSIRNLIAAAAAAALVLHALTPVAFAPAAAAAAAAAPPVPITGAHAHNDYEHSRPLLDALENGFCSIEADVHLVNGELLVAHELDQCRPDRTLRSMYLDPLLARSRAGAGRIYPAWPSVMLLIDMKVPDEQKPDAMYAAIRKLLESYREMLTSIDRDGKHERAVTVVLTGHRPRAIVAAEQERLVMLDGDLADLDAAPSPPADLIPIISANWEDSFTWRGAGPIPAGERARLRELAAKAGAQRRKLRFWSAPDNLPAWRELKADGVQLINTDHLGECRAFLLHANAIGSKPN